MLGVYLLSHNLMMRNYLFFWGCRPKLFQFRFYNILRLIIQVHCIWWTALFTIFAWYMLILEINSLIYIFSQIKSFNRMCFQALLFSQHLLYLFVSLESWCLLLFFSITTITLSFLFSVPSCSSFHMFFCLCCWAPFFIFLHQFLEIILDVGQLSFHLCEKSFTIGTISWLEWWAPIDFIGC